LPFSLRDRGQTQVAIAGGPKKKKKEKRREKKGKEEEQKLRTLPTSPDLLIYFSS
jgi:hypothetical protein